MRKHASYVRPPGGSKLMYRKRIAQALMRQFHLAKSTVGKIMELWVDPVAASRKSSMLVYTSL